MKEVWKDIPGYDGIYKISTKGRVKSINRYVKIGKNHFAERFHRGKIMKVHLSFGYEKLKLPIKKTGTVRYHTFSVHRLVAQAFLPNPLNKICVNHKNFDRTDNRVENIEWCTHRENTRHYRAHKMGIKLYNLKTSQNDTFVTKRIPEGTIHYH